MFREAVVIDYVTDYSALSAEQKAKILTGVNNKKFFKNCPNGAIIAAIVDDGSNLQKNIYYPFFSHIRMPIKAGERVWVFNQKDDLVSYWLSRKVQNDTADDLNFTHDLRADLYNRLSTSIQNAAQTTSSTFYDPNSSVVNLTEIRKNSSSRSEFVGEPVIAIKSKSVDLTLQGSNGTAIVMTNNGDPGTGTVDIIAGTSDLINLSESQKVTNSDKYIETIKPVQIAGLGTPKSSDASRVIVSRSFNTDAYYSFPGEDVGDVPTISLATDSIRILARNDLKIVAGSSSIIIKSDGNIIITPGSQIKLSGDNDNQAYLRYDDFKKIIDSITDTLGALQTAISAITSGTPGAAALTAVTPDISIYAANILSALETIKSQKILGS